MPKTDVPPAEAARLGGTVHPPLCEDVRHLCRMSEGYADDGRMPGAYGGLCRVSERYTLRGLVRHDLASAACLGTPASLGKWRQDDAVAFAAFPWGDTPSRTPSLLMVRNLCRASGGYALRMPLLLTVRNLCRLSGGTLRLLIQRSA